MTGSKAGQPVPAALEGDSAEFAVFTEIAIIAHLADTAFARLLPDGLTTAQFAVLNLLLRLGRQETIGELASALQEHVRSTLAPYKYPRAIHFVDALPKTSTGKIQRFVLRAEARQ